MSQGTLSLLVEKRPDVLTRIAGLCARRGFNIDSLAVDDAEERRRTRMTMVCSGDGRPTERITKQLDKLIDVVAVAELHDNERVTRELALIKLRSGARVEIARVARVFGADVIPAGLGTVVVEASGSPAAIDSLVMVLRDYGVIELVRSGPVAVTSTTLGGNRRRTTG